MERQETEQLGKETEEETEETSCAERQHKGNNNNRNTWKKVDTRTVILETSLTKTQDAKSGRGAQRFMTEKHNRQRRKKNQIVQNDLEYAQLLMGSDTHEQMCERMGNYDIATETRELKIQWIKVELLRNEEINSQGHYLHLLAK